jgi:hypothetical protein
VDSFISCETLTDKHLLKAVLAISAFEPWSPGLGSAFTQSSRSSSFLTWLDDLRLCGPLILLRYGHGLGWAAARMAHGEKKSKRQQRNR